MASKSSKAWNEQWRAPKTKRMRKKKSTHTFEKRKKKKKQTTNRRPKEWIHIHSLTIKKKLFLLFSIFDNSPNKLNSHLARRSLVLVFIYLEATLGTSIRSADFSWAIHLDCSLHCVRSAPHRAFKILEAFIIWKQLFWVISEFLRHLFIFIFSSLHSIHRHHFTGIKFHLAHMHVCALRIVCMQSDEICAASRFQSRILFIYFILWITLNGNRLKYFHFNWLFIVNCVYSKLFATNVNTFTKFAPNACVAVEICLWTEFIHLAFLQKSVPRYTLFYSTKSSNVLPSWCERFDLICR